MIPWIVVLVLSLGWANAMPDQDCAKKSGNPDQITLFQAGDHAQAPHGRVSDPQVLLAVPPSDPVWLALTFSRIYGIAGRGVDPVAGPMNGTAQGRAPPVKRAA